MLVKDLFGNEIFVATFTCVVKVPSGHAGINFGLRDAAQLNLNTLIIDLTFEDFVREWNRQH